MIQDIVILEANEREHFSDVLRMRLDLEKHMMKTNPGYWEYDKTVYEESCKRYFNDKNSKIYIAYLSSKKQVIGMGISVIEYHKDSPVDLTGNIHHLWVEPENRKNNVGKSIVLEIVNYFKSNGVQELILDYSYGNVEAEIFWRKLGYKPSIIMCSNTIENLKKNLGNTSM